MDWSGARLGAHRKIWLAEVCAGRVQRLQGGWSREAVTGELVRLARRAVASRERVVIGLDFSFGFPAWYAASNGWHRARDAWQGWTPERIERTLSRPEFPFWGRGEIRTRPAALVDASDTPPLRRTELRLTPRPFSVFQLVGAGAVGPASLRGMATLCALSDAGACVWPFDEDIGAPGALVLEIWPRLYAPSVNKSSSAARVAHVAGLAASAPSLRALERVVGESDDAFDALVGALTLWDARLQLSEMAGAADELERVEGRIWMPGVEAVRGVIA